MVAVPVNGKVLAWARKERGLTESQAAKLLKLSETELLDLEEGTTKPNLGLLDRMAIQYQIPFASLMMPNPLPDTLRPMLPDFRTHAGQKPEVDHELLTALDVVNMQIEMLVEVREGHPDLFVAPALQDYSKVAKPEDAANTERKRIAPTIDQQIGWAGVSPAFRRWRAIIERQGIFVHLMNIGPENAVRGFAIYDERKIPLALINGDEGETSARIFSLIHEYAHILIRQPGISDQNRKNSTERWCNQFAAYFLMPRDRFKTEAQQIDPTKTWSDSSIRKIADMFKVSMSAVALHLEDIGLAREGFYDQKRALWKPPKPRTGGMPMPYAERQVNRLGVRHVSVVLDALDKRYINQLDAYELTEVGPKHFDDLRSEIAGRQLEYGGVR
jgi:Zn-dependent peptidase ImmA (M78 family)/transcriptional regulator with XRE-family HTH domain